MSDPSPTKKQQKAGIVSDPVATKKLLDSLVGKAFDAEVERTGDTHGRACCRQCFGCGEHNVRRNGRVCPEVVGPVQAKYDQKGITTAADSTGTSFLLTHREHSAADLAAMYSEQKNEKEDGKKDGKNDEKKHGKKKKDGKHEKKA